MLLLQKTVFSLVACTMLSGCVAALLPLAAAGALGKTQIDRAKAKRELVAAGAVDLAQPKTDEPAVLEDGAQKEFSGKGGGVGEGVEVELDQEATDYLSRFLKPINTVSAPYADFTHFALEQAEKLAAGEGVKSVVLVPRVDIIKPQTIACMGKPLAVMIDLDDKSGEQWLDSDALYKQNDLAGALDQLRASEISVIWLSDQPTAAAERISTILSEGGLSATEADDFLFLDRGGDDRKQARRWDAARNYCIVAMAGDKRSDFDELYDYLRHPDGAITLEHMFGQGWFLTPPPLVPKLTVDGFDSTKEEQEEG